MGYLKDDESMPDNDGTVATEPKMMIAAGLSLSALALLLIVSCAWLLNLAHQKYWALLQQEAPLLVHSPGISFFYLIFPGLLGMLLMGVCAVMAEVRQSRNSPGRQRCMRVASYMMVIGVVAMFAGRYIGNWYWEETFSSAGYESCQMSFSLTKMWEQTVWVRDRSYCHDDEVQRMFLSSEHEASDINYYLKNSQKR